MSQHRTPCRWVSDTQPFWSDVYIGMGVATGRRDQGPLDFDFPITCLAKQACFLSFETEKRNFTTFSPTWKIFYGSLWKNPLLFPLEKSSRHPRPLRNTFSTKYPFSVIVTTIILNALYLQLLYCYIKLSLWKKSVYPSWGTFGHAPFVPQRVRGAPFKNHSRKWQVIVFRKEAL